MFTWKFCLNVTDAIETSKFLLLYQNLVVEYLKKIYFNLNDAHLFPRTCWLFSKKNTTSLSIVV